uniref:Uncharacterized protein n=1 Tax=Ditylenchus dipsaci TaxID=166011 RepID=A0A915D4G5_9BILA
MCGQLPQRESYVYGYCKRLHKVFLQEISLVLQSLLSPAMSIWLGHWQDKEIDTMLNRLNSARKTNDKQMRIEEDQFQDTKCDASFTSSSNLPTNCLFQDLLLIWPKKED